METLITGGAIRHGSLQRLRLVRLTTLRWAAPRDRAGTQVRALQSTGPAAEKHVHFDQLDSMFEEMGIGKELMEQVGGIRVRQHVNPLKKELQTPTPPLDWAAAYSDPSLPLALDVGCGYGRFPLALSRALPGHNMLGLEIREQCVERAQKWAQALGLAGRVRYARANATVSLDSMLTSYPGALDLVTIQFPDPHFKRRHRKRRVVQPQLVRALAALVRPGGRVLLQSDVEEVAAAMRDEFEEHGTHAFCLSRLHAPGAVFFSQQQGTSAAAQNSGGSSSSSSDDEGGSADGGSTDDGSAAAQQDVPPAAGEGGILVPQLEPGAHAELRDGGSSHGASESSSSSSSSMVGAGAGDGLGSAAAGSGGREGGAQRSSGLAWLEGGTAAPARRGRQQGAWAAGGWLLENPLGIPTERELYTRGQGLPVYRVLLVRKES